MIETVVSETSFYPIKPTEKGLIGFSSCLIDGKISLNSIAVYSTSTGDIRLLFPSKTLHNQKEIHVVYPVNREVYESIREAVKKKIESMRSKSNGYTVSSIQ